MKKLFYPLSVLIFILFCVSLLVADSLNESNPTTHDGIIRFAIISDRTGGHVPGICGQIAEEIELLRPDFVINVGDMIEGYVEDSAKIAAEWEEYDSIVSIFTMPYYRTPGNHDIWSDIAEKFYREFVGEPYYDFMIDDVHFIVMDLGRWDFGNDLPEEQVNWLTNTLSENNDARYTLVFMHKPVWYETAFRGKSDTLHTIFKEYGVDAVFTGHYHEYFSQEIDGIKCTSLGSSGATNEQHLSAMEYHFAWVTVDDEGIHVAPIKAESVEPWDETTATDKMAYDRLKHYGMKIEYAAKVDDDLSVHDQPISVVIDNSLSEYDIDDSIRWEVPENWNIEPKSMIVRVPAGQKQSYKFTASTVGSLYPVPQVATSMKFRPEKDVEIANSLLIAREEVCYPVTFEPVIDGNITEDFWRDPVTKFYQYGGVESTTDSTEFYFMHDDENLYVAAKCFDDKMDELTETATERDAMLFGDDCIGLFLEPSFESDTVYQIYFNTLRAIFDQRIDIGDDGWQNYDYNWNGNYEVGVYKGGNFWSIEVKIPVDQFDVTLENGQKWRVNFRRKQPSKNTSADWQTPIEFTADTYGMLLIR